MDDIDIIFYYTYNTDLSKAGINNKISALHHWETCGKNENREHVFNWLYYINLYEDLIKNKIDNKIKAFNHWLIHGRFENRECIFNWQFYINYYDDLIKNGIDTKEKAFEHWYNHGRFEKRLTIFNYEYYNKMNNLNLSKNEAFIHWLTIGKFNNFHYIEDIEKPIDFKFDMILLNDINIINDMLVTNNIANKLFNLDNYIEINSKVNNINKTIENFNWEFYLCYYPELVEMGIDNEIKATIH
jgi:hypothetical protein